MIDTGVGERPGRLGNEARPVFDALVGKLRIPSTRPGSAAEDQARPDGSWAMACFRQPDRGAKRQSAQRIEGNSARQGRGLPAVR